MYVGLSSHSSVDSELATCNVFSIVELYIDHKGGRAVKERKETTMNLNQCQVLLKHMLHSEVLNHSFTPMTLTVLSEM